MSTETHYLVIAMGGGLVAFGAGPDLEQAKADCEADSVGKFEGTTTATVFQSDLPGVFTWDWRGIFDSAGEPAKGVAHHVFETPELVPDFD